MHYAEREKKRERNTYLWLGQYGAQVGGDDDRTAARDGGVQAAGARRPKGQAERRGGGGECGDGLGVPGSRRLGPALGQLQVQAADPGPALLGYGERRHVRQERAAMGSAVRGVNPSGLLR
jgi:hypothetical protein